jgi:pantetheine-phosphate adenylyltransferase
MMPREDYIYLSSRLVKEVFSLGGNLTGLVPELVLARLRRRLRPTDPAPQDPAVKA